MKYRIAICDNEVYCVDKIREAILPLNHEQKCYSSPTPLLEDVKSNMYVPDIIFMDIVFEDEDGIDAIKEIQTINNEVKVIYISGYPNYAEKIFETSPIGFLIKPVTAERVVSVLKKAVGALDTSIDNVVNIKTPTAVFRIDKAKVMYIESKARKINIVLTDNVIEIYAKMNDITPLFDDFCRCHQSFLVNFKYVVSLSRYAMKLSNDVIIPISKSKHAQVRNEFVKYLGGLI